MSPAPDPVPQPRLYLDTSAYLCILLAEDGWKDLARQTEGAEFSRAFCWFWKRSETWFVWRGRER